MRGFAKPWMMGMVGAVGFLLGERGTEGDFPRFGMGARPGKSPLPPFAKGGKFRAIGDERSALATVHPYVLR